VAAVAWLAYSAYETGMRLRWLCSGECNIRLDLLAIYPLLLVLSLVALIALMRRRPRRS
jgi:ABC-type transport system involved in cytochrome c biogenesis permease subunit